MTRGPCKDCESRCVGCHAVCPVYRAYREKVDAERAERNAMLAARYYSEAKEKAMRKNLKRKRGGAHDRH